MRAPADQQHRKRPLDAPAVEAHEREHDGSADGEEQRQDVADPDPGQQQGGQGPVAAVVETAGDDTEEEQGQGEADGEAELAGHGGGDVAAVDGELAAEEVREGGGGETRRARKPQPGQPTEGPGGHRQGQQADHGDQLEGDVVRETYDRRAMATIGPGK